MAPILPPGKAGDIEIDHFTFDKKMADTHRVTSMFSREAPIPEGTYARLKIGGTTMMSDTPMEQRSNRYVVRKAKGDVLIAGLGIGMIVVAMAQDPEVKTITVIEKSADVIKLVEPHLHKVTKGKLTVIEADIFEFKPEKNQKWDTIYFDIWFHICTSNLDDMARLHRKYGRRKPEDGYMASWEHNTLLAERRRENANPYPRW